MPETIKLEDGTEREVPTQEELEEMQSRSETRKQQREEALGNLNETKGQLEKLQNKDFNFKRLRDLTDEQKGKLSEHEKTLMSQQEKLEEQQQTFTKTLQSEWKSEAMAVLAGDDRELRKEIEENLKLLNVSFESKKDMQGAVKKAYNMIGTNNNVIDNQLSFGGGGGGVGPSKPNKETKVDANFAKKFGLSEDDIKN